MQKGPAQAGYACLYPRAPLYCHTRRWGLPRASQQPAGLLAARYGAPCGLRCPARASRFAARSPLPTAAPAPVSCFRRRRRRPSQLFNLSPRLCKMTPQAGHACLYPHVLLRRHTRRWGLPRASQQPAGLLAARCGAPALFAPSPRLCKMTPQAGHAWGVILYAGGGGRTHTVSPPTDFESVSSASSNTPACNIGIINRLRPKVKPGRAVCGAPPLRVPRAFAIIAFC